MVFPCSLLVIWTLAQAVNRTSGRSGSASEDDPAVVFSDGKIIGCTCNIHYQNRLVTYDIIYQNNEELKRYA